MSHFHRFFSGKTGQQPWLNRYKKWKFYFTVGKIDAQTLECDNSDVIVKIKNMNKSEFKIRLSQS